MTAGPLTAAAVVLDDSDLRLTVEEWQTADRTVPLLRIADGGGVVIDTDGLLVFDVDALDDLIEALRVARPVLAQSLAEAVQEPRPAA